MAPVLVTEKHLFLFLSLNPPATYTVLFFIYYHTCDTQNLRMVQ